MSEATSAALARAREFVSTNAPQVPADTLPLFHATGGVGWINDPNGFSVYRGEYHLFFQYHPYGLLWGPMHWGHAKSRDLVRWELLPPALAPDTDADRDGCFSGSAAESPDGRQILMYTGVRKPDGRRELQTQCLAVGDGLDYEKLPGNPVLTGADLPEGGSRRDFRDPKLWREADGNWRAVIANRAEDGSGQILLYESPDALDWTLAGVLDRSRGELGQMWECPDFFPLDGTDVLLTSPQEMRAEPPEFHDGYGTLCLLGRFDPAGRAFHRERAQAIDYGLDFYAPQTLLTPDGRRVMIAWMQDWDSAEFCPPGLQFHGQMTLPRELRVRDGRLVQWPVRELEALRGAPVLHENVPVRGETELPGVRGRVLDLTLRVLPEPGTQGIREFRVELARGGGYVTALTWLPAEGVLRLDRSRGGVPERYVNQRDIPVEASVGVLELRLLLDRWSLEVFADRGLHAATCLIYAPQEHDGIRFVCDGQARVDVELYPLG